MEEVIPKQLEQVPIARLGPLLVPSKPESSITHSTHSINSLLPTESQTLYSRT